MKLRIFVCLLLLCAVMGTSHMRRKHHQKHQKPHTLLKGNDNFVVGVAQEEDSDNETQVNPKECHDAASPRWQRFKKVQAKIEAYKDQKKLLNMRFAQQLLDEVEQADNNVDSTYVDEYDQTDSQLNSFNELPQMDTLEPTIGGQSNLDLSDLTSMSLKSMYNNYRFKEGESLQEQVQESSFLTEKETAINHDGPVFMKSWGKFLHLDPKNNQKKLRFFMNSDWHEDQKKAQPTETLTDDHGDIEIPSQDSFFFQLTNAGVFVTATRRNDLARTVDSLPLANIKPIYKTKIGFSGGLQDQGNFAEGFCFRLNAQNGPEDLIWIVCVNDLKLKDDWMSQIAKTKQANTAFEAQPELEGYAVLGGKSLLGQGGGSDKYEQTGPDGEPIETNLHPNGQPEQGGVDGYWVVLQDWSTCTLACGGGSQTQHRQCVPPLPGGKPCVGQAVINRACNEQPCQPHPREETDDESLPLAVKMMQVSHRPQRYETCVIKEGDLEVVREDLSQFQRPPRVPARVVLNNQTFSVFETDHYDTVLYSVQLANLETLRYEEDENCFVAQDETSGNKITLCSLLTTTGISLKANINNWIQSIAFFQDKCQTKLNPIEDPVIPIKAKALSDEEEEAARAAKQQGPSPAKVEKVMNNVATMAIDAMSKEIKYESLAEKEELDRQKLEDMEARARLEAMKEKEECLRRDQRQNSASDRVAQQENSILAQVNEMKDSIKQLILNQRAKQSQKIKILRKLHDKKKRANDDEINDLKLKIAKDMMAAHNKGDMNLCKPTTPRAEVDLYCNRNFDTDPGLNQDCKDMDQFCYMCCETEYGAIHASERRECFAMCENSKPAGGSWIWVPESNQVKNRRRRRL